MQLEGAGNTVLPERIVNHGKLWERGAALLIDSIIILLISAVIASRFSFPYNWILVAWIYEAVQVSGFYQATVGQRVMGLKVSNYYGGRLGFSQASLRHFCKYLSLFTALSGYLIILLDKRNQCLHDKIAQTLVVTADSFQAAT